MYTKILPRYSPLGFKGEMTNAAPSESDMVRRAATRINQARVVAAERAATAMQAPVTVQLLTPVNEAGAAVRHTGGDAITLVSSAPRTVVQPAYTPTAPPAPTVSVADFVAPTVGPGSTVRPVSAPASNAPGDQSPAPTVPSAPASGSTSPSATAPGTSASTGASAAEVAAALNPALANILPDVLYSDTDANAGAGLPSTESEKPFPWWLVATIAAAFF